MFSLLLCLSSLTFTGTAIALSHNLFSLLPCLSVLASNLLFSGILGALLAALIWRRLAPVREQEQFAAQVARSLWFGAGGILALQVAIGLLVTTLIGKLLWESGTSATKLGATLKTILDTNMLTDGRDGRPVAPGLVEGRILDLRGGTNQGVGSPDDSTRIRVETSRRHIGRTIKTVLKCTLQVEAGRIVFAEPAGEHARWERSPRMET